MKNQVKKKVYVAMSGGVDSSVAAALLKKRGFAVTGVFMKPWQPGINPKSEIRNSTEIPGFAREPYPRKQSPNSEFQIPNSSFCLWKQDREDAMRVAAKLGIPLFTWDFSKEYKKSVTDYMIREYKAGRTPNPDVMCNKHIKFGLFLDKALKEGADFIATGHYIRIQKSKIKNIYKLLKAKDGDKDQSYFLWTLTQEQLKHCLFPIGDYLKPEVRKLAKKFGLPNHAKKDSQGVCFIGPLDMKQFLQKYIKPKRGKILDTNGDIIGYHDGVFYYTIGQRHGLDIKNGKGPYYVAGKNAHDNVLYVGAKNDLKGKSLRVKDMNWVNKVNLPRALDMRVRYRAELSRAMINNNGEIIFKKKETAITPGQSVVFYKKEELLGGGIIT